MEEPTAEWAFHQLAGCNWSASLMHLLLWDKGGTFLRDAQRGIPSSFFHVLLKLWYPAINLPQTPHRFDLDLPFLLFRASSDTCIYTHSDPRAFPKAGNDTTPAVGQRTTASAGSVPATQGALQSHPGDKRVSQQPKWWDRLQLPLMSTSQPVCSIMAEHLQCNCENRK